MIPKSPAKSVELEQPTSVELEANGTTGQVLPFAKSVTRDNSHLNPIIPTDKTDRKRTQKTRDSRTAVTSDAKLKKSKAIQGFRDLQVRFKTNGPGWDLHYDRGSGATRDRAYIAHLSKGTYQRIKKERKGEAFRSELRRWVVDRIAEKESGRV